MVINLGGIDLPGLLIPTRFGNEVQILAKVDYSLGGNPIIWEQENSSYALDLQGLDNVAWLTEAQMISIRNLAQVKDSTYTLIYESQTLTVRFRHESAPVLSGDRIVPSYEENNDSYYSNILIKLMVLTAPPV